MSLSQEDKHISLPSNQRQRRLQCKFMLSHVSGLHTMGGLLEIQADPKAGELFYALSKLVIFNLHKRDDGVHKRQWLENFGPYIFNPARVGSEMLNDSQIHFDQLISMQQLLYACGFGNQIFCPRGLTVMRSKHPGGNLISSRLKRPQQMSGL